MREYSELVLAPMSSRLIVISGQVAYANGEIVGVGNFEAQFQQVIANLRSVLSGVGATFRDVIKFTTYLVDPADVGRFRLERSNVFPALYSGSDWPANTLVVVSQLAEPDLLLEMEALASLPGPEPLRYETAPV